MPVDISNELNTIKSTQLGRTMRPALHDSIKKQNKELNRSSALIDEFIKNSQQVAPQNAEIIAARIDNTSNTPVAYDTLGKRLDKMKEDSENLNAQLSHLENIAIQSKTPYILNVGIDCNFKTIKSAIDYAISLGVSKTNRYKIKIGYGTYVEHLTLVDGIDIEGCGVESTKISYEGNVFRAHDTLNCSCDCSVKNITIIHINNTDEDLQNYPVHIDGRLDNSVKIFENVKIISLGKNAHHAIGVGLYGEQTLVLDNCELITENKASFYLHNQNNQEDSIKCTIRNTKIITSDNNSYACLFEDIDSKKLDEVKMIGCEMSGGLGEIKLQQHSLFDGARNTLHVRLKSCMYRNYDYDDLAGKIIDEDLGFFVDGLSNSDANPLILDNKKSLTIPLKISDIDDSPNFIGVSIAYGSMVFCQTRGVCKVISANVNFGDFLKTKSDASATVGAKNTDNCFAIALESTSTQHYEKIKCYIL